MGGHVVNSDFILAFGINSNGLSLVADSIPFIVWFGDAQSDFLNN